MEERLGKLSQAVLDMDVEQVENFAIKELSQVGVNYKVVQRVLDEHCFSKVSVEQRTLFVMKAVLVVRRDLRHLFLELLHENAATCKSAQVRAAAVASFSALALPDVESARVAVKIATAMQLTLEEVGGLQVLRETTARLLAMLDRGGSGSSKIVAPVVALLMHFPALKGEFELSGVLHMLIDQGQQSQACMLAAQLDHRMQVALVQHCIDAGKLKAALQSVRDLSLDDDFPDIELQYRRSCFAQLLEKRIWNAAAGFVDDDAAMQRELVACMIANGEMSMALDFATNYGLDMSSLEMSEAALEREALERAERYLSLPLEVIFVDSAAQLPGMASFLCKDDGIVGLDVEWKPGGLDMGAKSPASVVQIARRDCEGGIRVYIVDLLTLHADPALSSSLMPMFSSPSIIKLGLELSGDLSKLAASYPHVQAFQEVQSALDLKPVWHRFHTAVYGTEDRKHRSQVGLSFLSRTLLGKPLDKTMQVSDWSRRPLSQRQLAYCALDAAVQLQLLEAMLVPLGVLHREHLSALLKTWKAGSPKRAGPSTLAARPKPRADDRADDDGSDDGSGNGKKPPRDNSSETCAGSTLNGTSLPEPPGQPRDATSCQHNAQHDVIASGSVSLRHDGTTRCVAIYGLLQNPAGGTLTAGCRGTRATSHDLHLPTGMHGTRRNADASSTGRLALQSSARMELSMGSSMDRHVESSHPPLLVLMRAAPISALGPVTWALQESCLLRCGHPPRTERAAMTACVGHSAVHLAADMVPCIHTSSSHRLNATHLPAVRRQLRLLLVTCFVVTFAPLLFVHKPRTGAAPASSILQRPLELTRHLRLPTPCASAKRFARSFAIPSLIPSCAFSGCASADGPCVGEAPIYLTRHVRRSMHQRVNRSLGCGHHVGCYRSGKLLK